MLFRSIEALGSLDKSDVYIPGNDRNLLIWLGMAMALREKINVSFDNEAYEKLKVPRKDGGCYIAAATVKKKYNLPFDMRLYSACGPMIRDTNKYPVYSWQLTTCYDTRELGYADNKWEDWEYLYEFMTGRIKKEPENIEKYMRLRDKGYLTESDEVNVICMKHHGEWHKNTPLMKALPTITKEEGRLETIKGSVPNLAEERPGCGFADRCPNAKEICFRQKPELKEVSEGHMCACLFAEGGLNDE